MSVVLTYLAQITSQGYFPWRRLNPSLLMADNYMQLFLVVWELARFSFIHIVLSTVMSLYWYCLDDFVQIPWVKIHCHIQKTLPARKYLGPLTFVIFSSLLLQCDLGIWCRNCTVNVSTRGLTSNGYFLHFAWLRFL